MNSNITTSAAWLKFRKFSTRASFYLFMLIFAMIVLVPLFWVFGNAFRSNEEIGKFTTLQIKTFIPEHFTLQNFANIFSPGAFAKTTMNRVILNTAFVAVCSTFGSLLVNAMAAYALARIRFVGRKLIFALVISLLVLPIEILIIPLYFIILDLGLRDNLLSLILISLSTPFGIFFLRQFFLNIPKSLDEAAILDGAGHATIFFRIYLPLAKTPLITLGLLTFMQQWDSFIAPVTFMVSEHNMLLQVALTRLAVGLYANDYAIMFAGVTISIVPMVILFLIFQRYIVENIASAGIKG